MNDTPVALVTGGAGGIGSAIGRTLTSDGFQVVLAGRSLEAAQRVAGDIGESSCLRAYPGQVDVTDRESVATLVRDIGEKFGRLDVLVNNAGTEPSNSLRTPPSPTGGSDDGRQCQGRDADVAGKRAILACTGVRAAL